MSTPRCTLALLKLKERGNFSLYVSEILGDQHVVESKMRPIRSRKRTLLSL